MKNKYIISVILVLVIISCSISYAASEMYTWQVSANIVTSQNIMSNSENVNTVSNTITNSNETNCASNTITETNENLNKEVNDNETLPTVAEIENNNSLNLTSGAGILIEQSTGQVLYAHNIHEKLRPASVTKVMTILLIMEQIDSGNLAYTDTVACSQNASNMGGSQIWLDPREQLTVDEMLKAICVVSANDCTVAMAEHIAGSEEAFVKMMNDKAKELGMNDTTFKNCHGIDEDGHLTSAYDIAIMSRELLTKHPGITKYTTIYMDSLRDGKSQLVNTNKLVRNYDGCTGLKTGSTSLALFNLSASATRNGLSLISVIMKGETGPIRFAEAKKLLDYGFNNYQYKQLASNGDAVGTCNVNKGLESSVQAVFKEDYGLLLPKNNSKDIEQNVEIYNNVFAPIEKGQKVGEVTFKSDGNVIGTVALVSDKDVEKYGLGTMLGKVYTNWFSLLRK